MAYTSGADAGNRIRASYLTGVERSDILRCMDEERELRLDRIRTLFGADGCVEKRMFGGNAFMFHGNMAVGLMGTGELMVRVGPEAYESALDEEHVRPMDFTGRPMRGYVYVDTEGWESDEELDAWIQRGKDFAGTLPPK